MPSKFAGVCRGCGERYAVGETIAKLSEGWGTPPTPPVRPLTPASAPSRPMGTTGGRNAEYEDVCPLCGTLWEAGEPLAFLSAWAAGQYLGAASTSSRSPATMILAAYGHPLVARLDVVGDAARAANIGPADLYGVSTETTVAGEPNQTGCG